MKRKSLVYQHKLHVDFSFLWEPAVVGIFGVVPNSPPAI